MLYKSAWHYRTPGYAALATVIVWTPRHLAPGIAFRQPSEPRPSVLPRAAKSREKLSQKGAMSNRVDLSRFFGSRFYGLEATLVC